MACQRTPFFKKFFRSWLASSRFHLAAWHLPIGYSQDNRIWVLFLELLGLLCRDVVCVLSYLLVFFNEVAFLTSRMGTGSRQVKPG